MEDGGYGANFLLGRPMGVTRTNTRPTVTPKPRDRKSRPYIHFRMAIIAPDQLPDPRLQIREIRVRDFLSRKIRCQRQPFVLYSFPRNQSPPASRLPDNE